MKEQILKALSELGTTSEEVAISLSCLGVVAKGLDCPLEKHLDEKFDWHVAIGWVSGRATPRQNPSQSVIFDLPPPVQQFIVDFEDKKYPSLSG